MSDLSAGCGRSMVGLSCASLSDPMSEGPLSTPECKEFWTYFLAAGPVDSGSPDSGAPDGGAGEKPGDGSGS